MYDYLAAAPTHSWMEPSSSKETHGGSEGRVEGWTATNEIRSERSLCSAASGGIQKHDVSPPTGHAFRYQCTRPPLAATNKQSVEVLNAPLD